MAALFCRQQPQPGPRSAAHPHGLPARLAGQRAGRHSWQQIDLDTATIHIRRAKNGTPGIHGLEGDELRLLRALRREHPHADFVFLSERKAPLSVDGAQKLIERLGVAAELPFPIHAHMLRDAAGYAWALAGSTLERCRPLWAIARSRTRLSTPQWPTSGSETSGANENRPRPNNQA